MQVRVLIVAIAIAWSVVGSAEAQTTGEDAEARALFQAGQVAFDEGRYENALEYFRRSHEMSARPELLYNIGTAADRLRLDAEALQAFEQFLEALPDAPNRQQVEARIVVLRRQQISPTESTTEVRTTSESAPSDLVPMAAMEQAPVDAGVMTSSGPDTAPWFVLGAGIVGVAVGATLLGIAVSDVSSVENAAAGSSWSAVRDSYDRSEPMSIAGIVLIGWGGVAAIMGLVWGVVEVSSHGEPQVELTIGPGAINMRGSF